MALWLKKTSSILKSHFAPSLEFAFNMNLQIFSVGGALRDALLNQSVKDKDWVVVGGTPEEMTKLGYVTVGKDFPVFLHPTSREEYAPVSYTHLTLPTKRIV